ncbi:hypothetical protein D910_10885 [Dendroctonus ponderosae]|uniref:Uncharacterized protein n=1 Tax=Dendroctonus ponderosae TaxID=77166 RepID=U4UKF0_DENPD|nr:hypothetical protein D910_10885 [Dendroctonus ponderosae]
MWQTCVINLFKFSHRQQLYVKSAFAQAKLIIMDQEWEVRTICVTHRYYEAQNIPPRGDILCYEGLLHCKVLLLYILRWPSGL